MNLGDKAVLCGCVLIAAGWAGYELRDAEAAPPLHCSAWLEDGRPLVDSYTQANGRLLCTYADPMPAYSKRGKHPWM